MMYICGDIFSHNPKIHLNSMKKINSFDELQKLKNELNTTKPNGNVSTKKPVRIKIAMATCGIASGAKEVMDFFVTELKKRSVNCLISQTGCMGYCYAEPTVEITLPNHDPIVFGYVDVAKADEIIEKYIKTGELVDGIIPSNYEIIEDSH